MHSPVSTHGTGWRAVLVAVTFLCLTQPARAQVDMNGPWTANTIFGLHQFDCSMTFTQTGSSLGISATCGVIGNVTASGTINPATGEFSASGTAEGDCPAIQFTLGIANLDNRTFFAGLVCTGGPFGYQQAIQGFRCGNGVVDAVSGEQCDTALTACCTNSDCQFSPSGAFCSDGNQCTDDVCDGAGTCASTNRTGPCDDGNECTTPDECAAGSCTSTALPDGSPCEDFNACTSQSCQGGSCQIANLPDGTPCDDSSACFSGETCVSGACPLGNAVVCSACTTCQEPSGCVPILDQGHSYYGSTADYVRLRKTHMDSAKWRWISAQPLLPDDFGDPVTTTDYELCVFDTSNYDLVTGAPHLLFAASLPAGNNWRQTVNGFLYRGADKMKVRLKSGDAGRAKILVSGKGAAHPVAYLPPLSTPVEVQLRTAEGVFPQSLYYADYYNPVTSTATHYKGQNPEP